MEKIQRRFRINDLSEIIVGSVVLAFPVAITEEVWNLGTTLPLASSVIIVVSSLVFLAWFVYHTYYQSVMETHWKDLLARTLTTYAITLLVSALILTVLNQFPLLTDSAAAINRMILVALPASFCATVVDSLR
jgi:uncharacterized membrane protein